MHCARPRKSWKSWNKPISAYLEESEALFRKGTGFLNAIRSVLGTNTIKSSAIHQKFYQAVSEHVEQLAAQLEQTPDPELADQAARLLLEERPKGQDVTRARRLSAAQTLAIPLLPYVTRQTLETLCSDYCAAHRKRDRLPNRWSLSNKWSGCCNSSRKGRNGSIRMGRNTMHIQTKPLANPSGEAITDIY